MERRQIKPKTPQRMLINSKSALFDFIKKGYKVLSKLELRRRQYVARDLTLIHFKISLLTKIFKNLKYVRQLDLSKMVLLDKPYYSSKIKYYAKRISNAHTIGIFGLKTERRNFQGPSELWVKYAKNVQVFGYYCRVCRSSYNNPNLFSQSKNGPDLIHLMRYQSKIKDLAVEFDMNGLLLPELYFKFERYPPHLERFSFKGIAFDKPLTSSLQHLRKLKHFESGFNWNCTPEFISSLLILLPPNLRSLSLHWPQYAEMDPGLAFSKISLFKCLTTLKLCFQNTTSNLQQIFEPFYQSPLSHLKIQVNLQDEQQFAQITNFLANFGNLQRLQLQIRCETDLSNESPIEQLFQRIDNLSDLTRLSVSIISDPRLRVFALKSTLIPTKPISLKSLKIKLDHFIITTQDILRFLNALEPRASNLLKLKVEIGDCEPDIDESQKILNLISNFQNIKTLQFGDINIPRDSFLLDLAELIENMPNLENLAVGKFDKRFRTEIFISTIERILNKRGLKEFSFKISIAFYNQLQTANTKINLVNVLKRNPFLEKFPHIPIFDLTDYENDLW